MTDVTNILGQIEKGDPSAADELLPLVYEELRKLAAARMAEERSDHTLQATALVHEAYLRLVDVETAQKWNSRGHFFGAAAEAMRRILVGNARRKLSQKRGGGIERADLDVDRMEVPNDDDRLLALDEALAKLSQTEPVKCELVKLRYFAGLSIRDAAEFLGISTATADRYWAYARAWLQQEMAADGHT